MKQAFFCSIFLFIAILSYSQEKKVALVIGNSSYENGGVLKNPVNDANLISATLEDLDFNVTKIINGSKQELDIAILKFWRSLPNYTVALLYYAGHGIQVEGVNYLIPVDAKFEDKLSVQIEAIDVGKVVKQFELYPENTNIVILDACRDNPFRSWMRSNSNGFVPMNAPSGTFIAYATSAGTTASDGLGNNGLFTEKLVQQLKIPQRIEDVFINTRNEVRKESNGTQNPQEWSQLNGPFMFLRLESVTENVLAPKIGESSKLRKYGSIELTTEISGRLYIDDTFTSYVDAESKIPIDKVEIGEHKIEIKGNQNWMEVANVIENSLVQLYAKPVPKIKSNNEGFKYNNQQFMPLGETYNGYKFRWDTKNYFNSNFLNKEMRKVHRHLFAGQYMCVWSAIVLPVGILIITSNPGDQSVKPIAAGFIAGGVGLITGGVALWKSGRDKAKEFMDNYNLDYYSEIYFGPNPNGIGLAFRF